MSDVDDLVITIEVDTSRFDKAMAEARRALARLELRYALARKRREARRLRSRIVTRNKQRRNW